jgi:hypothetical protein
MLVWRLMHHKIPTDENLMNRGCHLPSMCSICYSCSESSSHIFFHCHFATAMWNWFFSIINIQGSITCTGDLMVEEEIIILKKDLTDPSAQWISLMHALPSHALL